MVTTKSTLHPLLALFENPAMLASFDAHGHVANSRVAGAELTFQESLSSVWVYTYAPKLLNNYPPSCYDIVLRKIQTGKNEVWADIQKGMLSMLLFHPKAYAFAQEHCEAFRHLEALPAMGWQSFDHVLNHKHWEHHWQMTIPGRRRGCFKLAEDRVDFIYVTDLYNWEHYRERIELKMPKRAPRTFGEEIHAMHNLLLQVAKAFDKCEMRRIKKGLERYRASPPEHRFKSGSRDVHEGVPVATWYRRTRAQPMSAQ